MSGSVAIVVDMGVEPMVYSGVNVYVETDARENSTLGLSLFCVEGGAMKATLPCHNLLLVPEVAEKANGIGANAIGREDI
jgi:hypothetical protein